MRIAICPGSYDPVTYGHLDIIQRSAKLFDKVVVTVMANPAKNNLFNVQERMDMLKMVTAHWPNVEIATHDGLVAEFARQKGACALVKGLRAVSDFEYEFQMALINKKLNPELETVFINTDAKFMYLSSSAAKEVAQYGGDLSDFVPKELESIIWSRMEQQRAAGGKNER